MAILQCLNCGRSNPDFLDNCQYCGKALKPGAKTEPLGSGDEGLESGTKPFGQQIHIPPEDLDIPEWLRNTGDLPALKTEPEGAGPVPAWLKAATDELKPLPTENAPVPDWLKAASKPLVEPSPSAESESGEMPDWLKAMGAGATGPLESEAEKPAMASDDDMPDWLKAATGPLDAEKPATASGDMPDWLMNATGKLPATPAAEPLGGEGTGPISITGPIEEEVPDWLKSMGATGPITTPAAAEPIQAETPDWLHGMSGSISGTAPFAIPVTPEPTPTSGEITGPIQEEMPDWLKSMGGSGGTNPLAAPATPEPEPASDLPDWLMNATGQLPPTPVIPSPASGEVTGPITGPIQEEMPDWLKSMGGTNPLAAPATPEPEPASDLPDWLMNATGQLPAMPAAEPLGGEGTGPISITGPIEEEVPDWLQSMGATGPIATPAAAEPIQAETPDWLQSMAGGTAPFALPATEPAAEELQAEETPDWLKAATGELPAEPAIFTPSEPVVPVQPETPDWLRGTGALGGTAPFAAPEPTPTPPTEGADLPDWLRTATGMLPGVMAAALPESAPAQPETPQPPPGIHTGELPDWLKTATGPLDKPPAPVNTGELPDWLKAATGPLTPPADMPPPPTAGELPDWLRSSTGPLTPAVQATPEISQAPQPDWLSELEKSGDDLGLIGAGAVAEDITLGAEATPPATPAGDEPDWLRALQSGAPAEAAPAEPVASEPNWLSNLRGEPEITETPAASGGDEPDWMAALRPTSKVEPQSTYTPPAELTQGELPNWLSALRPVDAGTHLEAEQDTYQETVGVLSGMRGVLRAEPSVVLPGKTATQVHTLDVTAEQNQQANAFLQLLQADTETTSTAPKKRLSVPWLRWLVTALLLLAVAARLIFPEQLNGFFPSPTTQKTVSAEVDDTWGTIESLPVNKPVLIAFDYEPGQQGEVGLLAESVTSHLIRRGLRLVAVSTSPTGAAVGQELLTKLASLPTLQPQPYIEADHYLNLGYLAGGPIGIAQFARSPASLVSRDFRGNAEVTLTVNKVPIKLWDLPLLNSVASITDFGALVVFTASPENARQWFEQTEVLRNSVEPRVPIIFVTSASAAPLVRPYYEVERSATGNAQAGLVSGPTAILEYEAKAGTAADLSFTYWDMVGYGTVMVGLLLVIGNLVYGFRQLWRQQRGKAA
ncbi:MAG: hypothetical protein JNL09_00840 [Anaerolineales bacterium]|nr:hypothetical protein [Anaerolineales bacterium]